MLLMTKTGGSGYQVTADGYATAPVGMSSFAGVTKGKGKSSKQQVQGQHNVTDGQYQTNKRGYKLCNAFQEGSC
eukprot:4036920-Amphidinium_carterae.1